MNTITKLAAGLALVATLAAPLSALAYYPYTYFTGPNYFMGGGGFSVGANYYGSSNCSDAYGCGTIGYNAMNGQWYNYNQQNYGYGGNYGYGQNYSGCAYYSYTGCGGVMPVQAYQNYMPVTSVSGYGNGYGNYGSSNYNGYASYNPYGGYRY